MLRRRTPLKRTRFMRSVTIPVSDGGVAVTWWQTLGVGLSRVGWYIEIRKAARS